ncbi:MAG TPA: enoyl-CoA hydratase [Gemmatimonadaceae bacterium]
MTAEGTVRLASRGAIASVTFDRPGARNAMSWTMYDQLSDALEQLDGNDSIRAVQFRGAHGHFVSGTDISQFEAFSSGDDGVAYERRLDAVVARIEALRMPTVAVVEGNAAGAGVLFATACDIRVCTPEARFSVPIARTVGNTLSSGSIARLVAYLGPARTKLLLMTAGSIDATAARDIGYVSAVVEPARLEQHIDELLTRLTELAPLTLRATKQMVQRLLNHVAQEEGDDLVREVYGSRDFREGVSAFREKRAPRWEGR